MAQTACSKCGAAAESAMGRPYCAKCGWNRDAAARRLQRVTGLLPALIVLFDLVGIIGIGFVMKNWPGAILFATLPTLLRRPAQGGHGPVSVTAPAGGRARPGQRP